MIQNKRSKHLQFAAVPLVLLLAVAALGVGSLQQAKAWDGKGGYWNQGPGPGLGPSLLGLLGESGGGSYWGQGGSEYYQSSCGYNCGGGGSEYHSYRYLVGFQDGVNDAQAGNNYDCQIGYHRVNYCNGYSAGYYSISNNQVAPEPQQQQNQESNSESTSTSYSQSNPHIVINNIIPGAGNHQGENN